MGGGGGAKSEEASTLGFEREGERERIHNPGEAIAILRFLREHGREKESGLKRKRENRVIRFLFLFFC